MQDWVQSGKAKQYIETSAYKSVGIDEVFQAAGTAAQEYQAALKGAVAEGLSHSIINMQQLRKGQKLSALQSPSAKDQKKQCQCCLYIVVVNMVLYTVNSQLWQCLRHLPGY